MQSKHRTSTFVLTGLASACLFGAATPASKVLLAGVQVQALAGLLYLGAALGVLPIILRNQTSSGLGEPVAGPFYCSLAPLYWGEY